MQGPPHVKLLIWYIIFLVDQEIQMQAMAQNTSTEVGQNMPETLADDIAMNVEDDMIMGQDLPDALLDEEDENDNDVGEEEEEDDHANEGKRHILALYRKSFQTSNYQHNLCDFICVGGAYMDRDPFVPNHPAAFILFILIVLFYGRYVSDHALEMMMFAFNMVLKILGIPYTFPSRVQPLKSWIKRQSDVHGGMREYVMCSTCSSIYPYQTQEEKERMQRHTHCVFKDTLQTSHKCRTPLFQSLDVTIASESTASRKKYIPVKRFYFNSVIHTLKSFFRRRLFASMLEETFERNVSGFGRPANYTCDVQHGSVYQEFKLNDNEDTIPFTKEDPFNLLLLLNMDHFQPHQYSSYSVGGVWLSILNLSHEERLLRKNTILSSILPGPREVSLYILH